MKEMKISGSVRTGLAVRGAIPVFIGVDDPGHYLANVEAYRESSKQMGRRRSEWLRQGTHIQSAKSRVFNPSLLAFDQKVHAYRDGALPLGDYLSSLAGQKKSALGPQTDAFIKALALETALDFQRVEKERRELAQALAQNLSSVQMFRLAGEGLAFRAGGISPGAFYGFLETFCRENGIDLRRFPEMRAYIRYALLSDRINAESLFREMGRLEKKAYDSLAMATEEKTLVKRSQAHALLGKLINFSLTPDEWKEYKGGKTGDLASLSSFEAFYREADARDETMTSGLLKAMAQNKVRAAALVTGGFHAPGIEERLLKANVAVISVAPKITRVDTENGGAYLSVFTQEKTPLEKLFAGQTLFLADEALNRAKKAELALAAIAATGEEGFLRSGADFFGISVYKISFRKGLVFFQALLNGFPVPVEAGLQQSGPAGKTTIEFLTVGATNKMQRGTPYSVREQWVKTYAYGIGGFLAAMILAPVSPEWLVMVSGLPLALAARHFLEAKAAQEELNILRKVTEEGFSEASSGKMEMIKGAFESLGFSPVFSSPNQLSLTIGNKKVTVRLPTYRQLGHLLSQNRLAATGAPGRIALIDRLAESLRAHFLGTKGKYAHIVVAPINDPVLLRRVILTEIHRVSPWQSLAAGISKRLKPGPRNIGLEGRDFIGVQLAKSVVFSLAAVIFGIVELAGADFNGAVLLAFLKDLIPHKWRANKDDSRWEALFSIIKDPTLDIDPVVNGKKLKDFEDFISLQGHIQDNCVIRDPNTIIAIFRDMDRIANGKLPETLMNVEELGMIYGGIFDQADFMKKYTEASPLEIVIFRGGRGGSSLTRHLASLPNVRVKAVVPGTDSGRSWFVPAKEFNMPGVPDIGKALLDLARNDGLRDLLELRFNPLETDEALRGEFREIMAIAEGRKVASAPSNEPGRPLAAADSRVVREFSRLFAGLNAESRLEFGKFLHTFDRVLNTKHLDVNMKFQNVPLRSIAFCGAVWHHGNLGKIDPWQAAIEAFQTMLNVRPGNGVFLASATPQHLMGMSKDGHIFLAETAINEFPASSEITDLWLVDKILSPDQLKIDILKHCAVDVVEPDVSAIKDEKLHPEVKATLLRIRADQATLANIQKVAVYLAGRSRTALRAGAINPVTIHDATWNAVASPKTRIVVYGNGTPESNIVSSLLVPGIPAALRRNPGAVKVFLANPDRENDPPGTTGLSLLRRWYGPFRGEIGAGKKMEWTPAEVHPYIDYALGRKKPAGNLDPGKDIPFDPDEINENTNNTVCAIALDLEGRNARSEVRPDDGAAPVPQASFNDPFVTESLVALFALREAGYEISPEGKLMPVSRIAASAGPTIEDLETHKGFIRERLKAAGVEDSLRETLVSEIENLHSKGQRWFYARLMRIAGIPPEQWYRLKKGEKPFSPEWAEMGGYKVQLLNQVTEFLAFDKDDTLDKKDTDLSDDMAKLLARRISRGQKIAIITAKSREELRKIKNRVRNERGIEIFTPLRRALIEILREERGGRSETEAVDAADDLLRDLFFLYMDTGATLARVKRRGIERERDLAFDEIYSRLYPPELDEEVKKLLTPSDPKHLPDILKSAIEEGKKAIREAAEREPDPKKAAAYREAARAEPTLEVYSLTLNNKLSFKVKIIYRPFGETESPRPIRQKVADRVNEIFKSKHLPLNANATGTRSIDLNLLVDQELIVKRRALEHLFNQGHRKGTFFDNEVYTGNAVSSRALLADMSKYPEEYKGLSLRVVSVGEKVSPDQMRGALQKENKDGNVPIMTEDTLRKIGIRPLEGVSLVIMGGKDGPAATRKYLDKVPTLALGPSPRSFKAGSWKKDPDYIRHHAWKETWIAAAFALLPLAAAILWPFVLGEPAPSALLQAIPYMALAPPAVFYLGHYPENREALSSPAVKLLTLESFLAVAPLFLVSLLPPWIVLTLSLILTALSSRHHRAINLRAGTNQSAAEPPADNFAPRLRTMDELPPAISAFLKINLDIGEEGGEEKIQHTVSTVRDALAKFQVVFLSTHFKRPKREDLADPEAKAEFSVDKVLKAAEPIWKEAGIDAEIVKLPENLDQIPEAIARARDANPGGRFLFVLENSRFYPAESSHYSGVQPTEEAQDAFIDELLIKLGNPSVYINEAIESHATDATVRMAQHFKPEARAAGGLFAGEVNKVLAFEARSRGPGMILWGGTKPDKIYKHLLSYLKSKKVKPGDLIVIAGALAYPFLEAQGIPVGLSRMPKGAELIKVKGALPIIFQAAERARARLLLPLDHVLVRRDKSVVDGSPAIIGNDQAAIDIGEESRAAIEREIDAIMDRHRLTGEGWIIANGGTGVFEENNGRQGTRRFLEKLEKAARAGVPVLLVGGDMFKAVQAVREKDWGGRELEPVIETTTAGGTILASLGKGIGNHPPVQALLKPAAPPVNSLAYLITRDWRWGGLGLVAEAFLLTAGGALPWPATVALFMAPLFLAHAAVATPRNPEEPLWRYILRLALTPRFALHMIMASPYALIGTPAWGDPATMIAVGWHLIYDAALMAWDQRLLARRDMRAFGADVPEPSSNPVMDFLIPPAEDLNIQSIDGRLALMNDVAGRFKAGGPYVAEWTRHVNTLARVHVVGSLEEANQIQRTLEILDGASPGSVQTILIPGRNEVQLIERLKAMASSARGVSLAGFDFDDAGVTLSHRWFLEWINGKGSVAWLTTKGENTLTVRTDAPNLDSFPALKALMELLLTAPPITSVNLNAIRDIALAFLRAA